MSLLRRVPDPATSEFSRDQLTQMMRRQFLTSCASGLGGLGLLSVLAQDGAATEQGSSQEGNLLLPKSPHFAPSAKACIFIFLAGAPSHVDLYDPKPVLQERNGQQLPKSLTEKVRFAFIKKESAILMGSRRKFTPYGDCGMELSDLLPHVGTCADDIAFSLARLSHMQLVFPVYSAAERFAGLTLKAKKCKIVLCCIFDEDNAFKAKQWLSKYLPSWQEFWQTPPDSGEPDVAAPAELEEFLATMRRGAPDPRIRVR